MKLNKLDERLEADFPEQIQAVRQFYFRELEGKNGGANTH